MKHFFSLVAVEIFKMEKRLSTKVMLLIMVGIVAASAGLVRFYQYKTNVDVRAVPTAEAGWQDKLQQQVAGMKAQRSALLNKPDSTSARASLGQLDKTIAESEYRLSNNIATEEPDSIWTKMLDFGENAGFSSLIALMLIIACSAAVAGEFSEGTIKMMIPRPYRRHEILSAKLIASLLYGLILLAATLLVNFVLFVLFYGAPGPGAYEMLWTTHRVLYVPAILKLLAFYGLGFLEAVFYMVLAFALSAVTRSRSIATGFSLFMLLAGAQLAQLVAILFGWAKWLPFTTTHFSGMMTQGIMVSGTSLQSSLVMTGIYTLAFGALGYFVFSKRDI